MNIRVVYRAKDFLVVHKPSGFVVYQDAPNSPPGVLEELGKKMKQKLYPVHRLDRDTCGLLAVALTPAAANRWSETFRGRGVQKVYRAIVHGTPEARGIIAEPLEKHKDKKLEDAKTQYLRLGTAEIELEGEKRSYSLLKLEPKTGRYHQIRRHLKMVGHPIIGDPQYGNGWDNKSFQKNFSLKRTLLCATDLYFRDPFKGDTVHVSTKPDPDFLAIARKLGWEWRT